MWVTRVAVLCLLATLLVAPRAAAQDDSPVELPGGPPPPVLGAPAPDLTAPAGPPANTTATPTPEATPVPTAEPTPEATPKPLPEGRTLRSALRRAWLARRIDRAEYRRGLKTLAATDRALRRLRGRRRAELARVRGMVAQLAAEGRLHSSRLGLAMATLRQNTLAWRTQPLPRARERRRFEGLVFQYIAGRGFHHHPLGSAGRVNALVKPCMVVARRQRRAHVRRAQAGALLTRTGTGPRWIEREARRDLRRRARKAARERRERNPACRRVALRRAADGLVAVAADRGGFPAWEYLFSFGGRQWPWISGMAQGTIVQALARSAEALGEREYRELAERALGAFEKPAPLGVRVGGRYAMYSQTPSLDILNGFLQALIGLHDHAELTGSERSAALFRRAEKLAPAAVRAADTGAWSLYSRGGREASLHYHRLVRRFLGRLCNRTERKAYCSAARRFAFYEQEPPAVAPIWPRRPRARETSQITFTLSKISTVRIRGRGYERRLRLPRGRHSVLWTPRFKGRQTLRLSATGPEGRTATVVHRTRVARSYAEIEARRRRREARRRERLERRERAERRERRDRRERERAARRREDERRAERERAAAKATPAPQS